MNVGIILHGKPNEGSHIAQNIDGSLLEKIVSEFFADLPHRPAVAWLIADARYWQNKWYSVYTFWCGSNGMKDTSNRNSYIALTVVIDGCYCTLVSEMYEHLKRVYEELIVGRYVAQGKYLVGNLSDPTLFQVLLGGLSVGFPETMRSFDNTFLPQSRMNDSVEYNVVDCDAKAFVNDWKKCGRIIVSPQATTKDSYLNLAKEYKDELEMSKRKHREKDERIQTLTNDKTSLQTELNRTNLSKGELSKEINTLRSQVADLQVHRQVATDALAKIATIVTEFAKVTPPPEIKSTESIWAKIKKSFDTFILILILVGVVAFVCKAFIPNEVEQKEMTQMKAQITDMYNMLSQLRYTVAETQQIEDSYHSETGAGDNSAATPKQVASTKDVDCQIRVTQGDKSISKSGGTVDFSKPIHITIGKPMEGYEIHTDNISNDQIVKSQIIKGQEVAINPKDNSTEVVICYRSANRDDANTNNKITLKKQK